MNITGEIGGQDLEGVIPRTDIRATTANYEVIEGVTSPSIEMTAETNNTALQGYIQEER